MKQLISKVRSCTECLPHLEHGANPVFALHKNSQVVIIGQAPGMKVHQSGIPWADKSGERLMDWLGVDSDKFYDQKSFAILPMSFCYPGKGKSGDLAPRKECAPLWHQKLLDKLESVQLILLVGSYAQKYYLGDKCKPTLTETVKNFKAYLPTYFPLPHPSPRNNIWLRKNEWFEKEVIPELKSRVSLSL